MKTMIIVAAFGIFMVGSPALTNWILATGTWNDSNVWLDNAVWID